MTFSSFARVATALALLSAAGCSDNRCSAANCKTLIDTCHVAPSGDPLASVCVNVGGGAPAGYDFSQFCPASCREENNGALVQCLVAEPACGDVTGGGQQTALTKCSPPRGTVDATCSASCTSSRRDCEVGCKTKSTFDGCMQCASTCGLQDDDCQQKCTS